MFDSAILEIKDKEVTIKSVDGELILPNDYVFIFAGGEPPFKLLKQIGIQFGGDQGSPINR